MARIFRWDIQLPVGASFIEEVQFLDPATKLPINLSSHTYKIDVIGPDGSSWLTTGPTFVNDPAAATTFQVGGDASGWLLMRATKSGIEAITYTDPIGRWFVDEFDGSEYRRLYEGLAVIHPRTLP